MGMQIKGVLILVLRSIMRGFNIQEVHFKHLV